MKEYVYIGSSPPDEDCAQVGTDDYGVRARRECRAYINQLYRFLKEKGYPKESLPSNFELITKVGLHDFGQYYEVVCAIDSSVESNAWEIALLLENTGPSSWDDEARKELGLKYKEEDYLPLPSLSDSPTMEERDPSDWDPAELLL